MRTTAPGFVFLLRRLKQASPDAYAHSIRVAKDCSRLAHWLGFREEDAERTSRTALLHDIGLIRLPSETLRSRSYSYRETDRHDYQQHPVWGAELAEEWLTHNPDAGIDPDLIRWHHEWLDGTGYPFGVDWKSMSPELRVLQVCDLHDDYASSGMSREDVFEEMYRWADMQVDADMLDAFRAMKATDAEAPLPLHSIVNAVQVADEIESLRVQLRQHVHRFKALTHPEVVSLSEALDRKITEYYATYRVGV